MKIQWKPLNVIMVNVISRLVQSTGYCYHLVNVISFSQSQIDHIKQLQLYILIQTETLLGLGISICLDVISIETLDLDIWKKPYHVLTVEIFSTVQNPCLDSLHYPKILIYLYFCWCLDLNLDLDSLKKDISTDREISISITFWSRYLDRRD